MRNALVLAAVLLLGGAMVSAQETIDRFEPVDEDFPVLGWPTGDPDAGRQAFTDLKCTACHAVPSVADLADASGTLPGPPLVKAEYARARLLLLRQIVAPGSNQRDQVSHMGNFAESMTVQQLTDLVAFIEWIDREGD